MSSEVAPYLSWCDVQTSCEWCTEDSSRSVLDNSMMQFCKIFDDDGDAGYLDNDGSDDEWNPLSSEEEDDFNDFIKSREMKYIDEFQAEMDRELDETMAKVEADSDLRKPRKIRFEEGESSQNEDSIKKSEKEENKDDREPESSTNKEKFYDDVYFDSDSDSELEEIEPETSKTKRKSKRHPIPSNDDLFYDPDMDDADQKWIDDYRRSCQPKPPEGKSSSSVKPLPNSDAVLNCPACMSLLCLDCQRHSIYSTQYRAMFVQNCSINFEQTLNCPLKTQKKGKNNTTSQDVFHPVKCEICDTEVAVYDKDEVYHFFNVLSSYA